MQNQLYKIIFIEDEEPLRKAICQSVNWQNNGFKLVFQGNNGVEALEYIKKDIPDVLITDICMPLMDGLELSKVVNEKYSSIKKIILSGYDEFEYARRAVEYNVSKYILKPITLKEFEDELNNIRIILDKEYMKNQITKKYQYFYRESKAVIKKEQLLELINGSCSYNEIRNKLNQLNINTNYSNYIVSAIHIEEKNIIASKHWGSDEKLLDFSIFNVSEEILNRKRQDLLLFNEDNILIIIFKDNFMKNKGFENNCIDIIDEIKFNIKKYFNLCCSIGMSNECTNINKISNAYQQAIKALKYRAVLGKGKIITSKEIYNKKALAYSQINSMIRRLIQTIKTGRTDTVVKQLDYLITVLKANNIEVVDFKKAVTKIISTITNAFNEVINDDQNEIIIDYDIFNKIFENDGIEGVKVYYRNLCNVYNECIKQKNNKEKLVTKVTAYIYEKYSDENLDIPQICDYFHISPSYFSRIFKNEKGETFIELLTRIRMEKSQELLIKSNKRVSEIAQEVGYEDAHYFSYNFKKQIGVTPTQYRKGGVNTCLKNL